MLSERIYNIEGHTFDGLTNIWSYQGEKIPNLIETHKWSLVKFGTLGMSSIQSHAIYDKYLFAFNNTHTSVRIYNLETNSAITTVSMTATSGMHCNNACFGTKFYDENDEFPVLYTSGGSVGDYYTVEVFRVQHEDDTWSLTLVQTITLPTSSGQTSLSWSQIAIDPYTTKMWLRSNSYWARLVQPNLSESSVTMTESDIKEIFPISLVYDYNAHQQGFFIYKNISYSLMGVPSWGDIAYMKVYNLSSKSEINTINFTAAGFNFEPEGIGLYDGHLIISDNSGNLYRLYLE